MLSARVLQRVVFPLGLDADVLPLYLEAGQVMAIGQGAPTSASSPQSSISAEQHPENVLSRRQVRVPAGSRISLASYFNAFPASYWQRWTRLPQVELGVRLNGAGTVLVYRSGATGSSERVDAQVRPADDDAELVFRLPLSKFVDGGWYWFDVIAGQDDVVLEEAEWREPEPAAPETPAPDAPGTLTIGITTFNRPDYLLALLEQFAEAPEVLECVDELLVVDQGSQRVRQQAGFDEVEASLLGKLRVIEQANVGGSGGFARSMLETLAAGRSRYVLLVDDDVKAEPEALLRAVAFADRCRRPTVVGGHMFNLLAPSTLHSLGEVVRPWRFNWGSATTVRPDHDFRGAGLRSTSWMHRRVDVDYNGWWMCLIPVEVLKTIGLSLPFFIKWDDAEYGLRAAAAGYPTVSMPGVAIWHMPWGEKDDALDWQAYFHQRNRIVTALLHSQYPHGGRVPRDSLYQQVRHLLAMQYSVADLRLSALQDILDGPEQLHGQLFTKLPEVRAIRESYDDSRTALDIEAFPTVGGNKKLLRDREPVAPQGRLANLVAAAVVSLKQHLPVPEEALQRPQELVSAQDAHWWRLAQLNSALVSTLDGTSMSWYRRDRQRYTELMTRSWRLHERLLKEWPALAQRYREAAPDLVAPHTWAATFEALEATRSGSSSSG